MQEHDCRNEVFRQRGYEVLGSVVQGTQLAFPDPFDVNRLHAEARAAFASTLHLVQTTGISRILLIRGEAGCGKTHLIRSLRWQTHTRQQGVVAYVHMTSEQVDYRQYLLRQVVRSLNDPYVLQPDQAHQSALDLISDALVTQGGLPPEAAELLRDADDATLANLVSDYADDLSEVKDSGGGARFAEVDLNTLRIFLYRQNTRKPIQRRVGSFLNGESLSAMDWQKLSAMPQDCNRSPMHLLGQLARVVNAALGMPLIICVDQIEASDLTGTNEAPFIRAMSTACELFEQERHLMLLLSCLDSVYQAHSPRLVEGYRHRIESDPDYVRLTAARNADEIRQIVSRRLKWLYESEGLEHVPPDSVYPLPETVPDQLNSGSLRRVLQQIHRYWDEYHRGGTPELPVWNAGPTLPTPDEKHSADDVDRLRNAWNDFRTAGDFAIGEDDEEQFELLAWALAETGKELPDDTTLAIAPTDLKTPLSMRVVVNAPRTEALDRLVGLCDKFPQGRGLVNQLEALEEKWARGNQQIVVVRSTSFPKTGSTLKHLLKMDAAGHLRTVIEDPSWRTIKAMREFLQHRAGAFAAGVVGEWRRTDGPLLGIPGIAIIVQPRRTGAAIAAPAAAHTVPVTATPATHAPSSPNGRPAAPSAASEDAAASQAASIRRPHAIELPPPPPGPMVIGTSDGFSSADVTLDPQILTRHTAILGANGSGKSVLALTIVEMLLERGVSAILFDRKGDLASYAVDSRWRESTSAPDEVARRAALRSRVDIDLYTPGSSSGRPLVLPLLPTALDRLPEDERLEQARQAALVLCGVCAPSPGKSDLFATVLARAIELLCGADVTRTLDELQQMLLMPPQELLAMLPAHETKHCVEVGRRLNERRVVHGRLFSDQGEKLDLRAMLSGSAPGRARLNIISTQFLDGDSGLIWISQFLAEAGRFILRHPSPAGTLQAVLMFDEADQYIPATRKPVTKPGMENLLRRARAAGVGVMLASQNVGDFDYKALDNITTVFAGKLSTRTALEKLRSRLGDAIDRLARKSKGQFVMAVENEVREIKGHMCLIRPTPVPRDEIEQLAASQLAVSV